MTLTVGRQKQLNTLAFRFAQEIENYINEFMDDVAAEYAEIEDESGKLILSEEEEELILDVIRSYI